VIGRSPEVLFCVARLVFATYSDQFSGSAAHTKSWKEKDLLILIYEGYLIQ